MKQFTQTRANHSHIYMWMWIMDIRIYVEIHLFQNINECVFSSWSKYKIFTYKQCWWTPNSLFSFLLFSSFLFFLSILVFVSFCAPQQPFMNYDKTNSNDFRIKFDFCIFCMPLTVKLVFNILDPFEQFTWLENGTKIHNFYCPSVSLSLSLSLRVLMLPAYGALD